MKEGFRQSQAWLHNWSGLVVGWLLFMIFITGTLSFFREEITYWMQPELYTATPVKEQSQAVILERALRQLAVSAKEANFLSITLPSERNQNVKVSWFTPKERGRFLLDPNTGGKITPRATVGGDFFYRMHYQLWYLSPFTGRIIICMVTFVMLVTLITGIITHKKIFKDYFVLRTNKGQRSWLDGHIIAGVIALPFHLMITFSGLIILINFFMPWGSNAVYGTQGGKLYQEAFNFPNFGEPTSGIQQPMPSPSSLIEQFNRIYPNQKISYITVYKPNQTNSKIVLSAETPDAINPLGVVFNNEGQIIGQIQAAGPAAATQNTLNYLHRGHFASYWLRWLYFISGIAGSFMIASGLILWSIKRQAKLKKNASQKYPFSHRLVQILNVATIAGICVAIPSLLVINRLLPYSLHQRQKWEAHLFFIIWAATLIYSIIRTYKKAWSELFICASLTCLAIPISNWLNSTVMSLYKINWQLVPVDLTALAFSVIFLWLSYKIAHHKNIRIPNKTNPNQAINPIMEQ